MTSISYEPAIIASHTCILHKWGSYISTLIASWGSQLQNPSSYIFPTWKNVWRYFQIWRNKLMVHALRDFSIHMISQREGSLHIKVVSFLHTWRIIVNLWWYNIIPLRTIIYVLMLGLVPPAMPLWSIWRFSLQLAVPLWSENGNCHPLGLLWLLSFFIGP